MQTLAWTTTALATLAWSAAMAQTAPAPLLSPVFADHAVLQRDKPILVWGWADPKAKVAVALGGEMAAAKADASGRWQALLPALPAGGPYDLSATVAGGASQAIHDVMLGDVWLCSGQSNMEFQLRKATNADSEIANSANPNIRLFQVAHISAPTPRARFTEPVAWRPAGPEAVRDFSAACYFMGRELQGAEHVPIGLIDASWGGSPIQDWLSGDKVRALGGYDPALAALRQYAVSPEEAQAGWGQVMDDWWRSRDPGVAGPVAWSDAAFDDSAWPSMEIKGFWEDAGVPELRSFDGAVWFRTTVSLTAEQAAGAATLALGPVDDLDATWINGVRVGGSEGWNTPRNYAVPAGVLKPGRNVVAVRVLDTGGGGGLWGPAAEKALHLANGSAAVLEPVWRYRIAASVEKLGAPPHVPWLGGSGLTTLNNGMIAPLAGYGLRGAAWYQGEANVAEPPEYGRLLPALIADWRRLFRDPDLTFLAVQLAGFGQPTSQPTDTGWARLREVQRRVTDADPHTGLALAIDIGDPYDIHPTQKLKVGQRLALQARKVAYGEAVEASGPTLATAHRSGATVEIAFAHAAGGLVIHGSNRPAGFELCDASGRCRFVDATVTGDKVTLDTSAVPDADRVRFQWADSPVCNLFNAEGLPAVPFELSIG